MLGLWDIEMSHDRLVPRDARPGVASIQFAVGALHAANGQTQVPGGETMGKIISCYESGERYTALRVIGFLFSLLGTLFLVLGGFLLALAIFAFATGPNGVPPEGADPFTLREVGSQSLITRLGGAFYLLWAFASLVSGLQLIAVGALFRLLIHLEENTRASAIALDKLRRNLEPKAQGVEPSFLS